MTTVAWLCFGQEPAGWGGGGGGRKGCPAVFPAWPDVPLATQPGGGGVVFQGSLEQQHEDLGVFIGPFWKDSISGSFSDVPTSSAAQAPIGTVGALPAGNLHRVAQGSVRSARGRGTDRRDGESPRQRLTHEAVPYLTQAPRQIDEGGFGSFSTWSGDSGWWPWEKGHHSLVAPQSK